MARIVARMLKINKREVIEINAASSKGIDMVRSIESNMGFRPIAGKAKLYIIDEAHQLTAAAQDSFLKPLEEPPAHVYFALCTTDPQKLKATIRTRCTEVVLQSLTDKDGIRLIDWVAEKESLSFTKATKQKLIQVSDGSARKILVYMNQIASIEGEEARLSVLNQKDAQAAGIDLCRALMDRSKKWPDIAKILAAIDQDAESVRRQVIGYATAVLLRQANPKAALVLASFIENVYDSGKPGLVLQAYLCFHDK
jgi:DNA polymerase-3 subunit gamma/tau